VYWKSDPNTDCQSGTPDPLSSRRSRQRNLTWREQTQLQSIARDPASYRPRSRRRNRLSNTAGILAPGVDARIVREGGTEADYNEPGELRLTGASPAVGYWRNPKATVETCFVDGQGRRWLKTGDSFKVNEPGFFFEDRRKVCRALLPRAQGYYESQWVPSLSRRDRSCPA
jgi:acyl-CoA synthetase (AMP-forming)/AMP-acid ligase II